jgi:hypothetical protein
MSDLVSEILRQAYFVPLQATGQNDDCVAVVQPFTVVISTVVLTKWRDLRVCDQVVAKLPCG